jgi:hypothetical protein
VARQPDAAVALEVDEVPGRERKLVERPQHRPRRRATQRALLRPGDAGHLAGRAAREQPRHELAERQLAFTEDDGGGASREVRLRMVGRVRAGHDDPAAGRASGRDHAERRLAHAQQAHLAQVVEAVLVEDGEARARVVERLPPLALGRGEHRVVERDAQAAAAEPGRRVEGAERRVGLGGGLLLGVEAQRVGLPDQDLGRHA